MPGLLTVTHVKPGSGRPTPSRPHACGGPFFGTNCRSASGTAGTSLMPFAIRNCHITSHAAQPPELPEHPPELPYHISCRSASGTAGSPSRTAVPRLMPHLRPPCSKNVLGHFYFLSVGGCGPMEHVDVVAAGRRAWTIVSRQRCSDSSVYPSRGLTSSLMHEVCAPSAAVPSGSHSVDHGGIRGEPEGYECV
jgi:hypothetical protein